MSGGIRQLDLDAIRAELAGTHGADFWRRIQEFVDEPGFQELLRRTFPSQTGRWLEGDRRTFLRLMAGSLAVAGLGACTRQPEEAIVPYASRPEALIPGVPRFFATALPRPTGALGVLVESHMNRPTKIEGNPEHPASLGATDALAQAEILTMYDPDRASPVLRLGQIASWDDLTAALEAMLDRVSHDGGRGLRILSGHLDSPTAIAQRSRLLERLPEAVWHDWEPIDDANVLEGVQAAFGEPLQPVHEFAAARCFLALDGDFLMDDGLAVRNARGFAAARQVEVGADFRPRSYVAEASVGPSGSIADHRVGARPSELEGVLRAVGKALGLAVTAPTLRPRLARFAAAAASDLEAAGERALVTVGRHCHPRLHQLAAAIHQRLGAIGTTVTFVPPIDPRERARARGITALVGALNAGQVDALIVLGGNPVYDAPSDLDFRAAYLKAQLRVHLGLYVDETSQLSTWHVALAHALESWSDTRALDGTASIVQPLIAPLYAGRTTHELLATLMGRHGVGAYDLVRETWRALRPELDDGAFEVFWKTSLHDGVIAGSAFQPVGVRPARLDLGAPPPFANGLEVALRADPNVFDGRYANNAWLQETPRPLTRLVWDNAALISPSTAAALGVESGDVCTLEHEGRSLEAPVWLTPGHPDDVVTLHLGYGHWAFGSVANGVGFDAYRLRTTANLWNLAGVTLRRTEQRYALVTVQEQLSMEGRRPVRTAPLAVFAHEPDNVFPIHGHHDYGDASMYPDYEYPGYSWGMVIDLNSCTGCNACMVACQSENNVPVVGKAEVALGREMHWLRIDRYYEEPVRGEELLVHHQPLLCMHCERAPCEVVCPVAATVHGDEGLNEMVYNRCVGTRYCSNNCPYKVRRFNFYRYADFENETKKLGANPDVTIRSRGVMEKCTYCVQRINHARIEAKLEEREIRDGDVVTACQQVCPTRAITFGDINDPNSAVSRLKARPNDYGLLEELGTKPRTTYLAKLLNPNPELEPGR
ncbi:MAG: Fe-S-cluster-containing hydrogenase [Planctomycetota bacterium]